MRVCIVGYGKVGKLHWERWITLKHKVIVVDPICSDATIPIYPYIANIPSNVRNKIDIWDICTPTSSHLSFILAILDHDPKANILVEKPICDVDQIDLLENRILKGYEKLESKIIVNDPYNFSVPIIECLKLIERKYSREDITEIYIEFSKNRSRDEKKGRFIDKKSGALGYEWFHMLSILNRVLSAYDMKEYLSSSISPYTFSFLMDQKGFFDNIEEKTQLSAHRKISLYTSMQGHIGYPLKDFFKEEDLHCLPGLTQKTHIKYGDERRYRAVHIILKKARFSVLFGYNGYEKNHHIILFKSNNNLKVYHIFQDHMLDAIKSSCSSFKKNHPTKISSLEKALRFESRILKITNFMNNFTHKQRGAI